jgi:hypothetical protein
MSFQVQVRKDDAGVAGACVRIEFAGGSLEGETDADGWVTFDHDRPGPMTLFLDGQRRGTYDRETNQSVTILT